MIIQERRVRKNIGAQDFYTVVHSNSSYI